MERLRLCGGTELAFITEGEASKPAVLLLHGTPNSSRMFREVVPALAQTSYVIAPDLPGHGESDALPDVSFSAIGQAVSELLDYLGIGPRFIYLHDWGAPVGLQIAMQAPEQVLGLIVQNANAHQTGWGPGWAATRAYWSQPNTENEAAATAHLTLAGTRDTYISGVPEDVAERIPAERWEEDWRVMNLPGHMETQRALIADYGNYAAPLRRHCQVSRELAARCLDDLGETRCLFRPRRGAVVDARAAEDGSPCPRCRPPAA
jgi:pimeloyl-ACP methyl ester carboxylesterase